MHFGVKRRKKFKLLLCFLSTKKSDVLLTDISITETIDHKGNKRVLFKIPTKGVDTKAVKDYLKQITQ